MQIQIYKIIGLPFKHSGKVHKSKKKIDEMKISKQQFSRSLINIKHTFLVILYQIVIDLPMKALYC